VLEFLLFIVAGIYIKAGQNFDEIKVNVTIIFALPFFDMALILV